MAQFAEFAPAKINLTLRVIGRRPDGYHELESLVAFALDAGDRMTLKPGPEQSLRVSGPEASRIDGPNLITAVSEALRVEDPSLTTGAVHLEKNLPVASGIGGGSADAAATIRLIARANNIPDPETRFANVAAELGADIPVCIGAAGRSPEAAFMSGIGDKVWRPSESSLLPPGGLAAVLVNPRVPVSTGAVFQSLAAPLLGATASEPQPPSPFATVQDCLSYIKAQSNDLEAPAIRIAPEIAEVLAALRNLPGCRFARMSGSGATCFGLFDDIVGAQAAVDHLGVEHANWWIAATTLA